MPRCCCCCFMAKDFACALVETRDGHTLVRTMAHKGQQTGEKEDEGHEGCGVRDLESELQGACRNGDWLVSRGCADPSVPGRPLYSWFLMTDMVR